MNGVLIKFSAGVRQWGIMAQGTIDRILVAIHVIIRIKEFLKLLFTFDIPVDSQE